MNRPLGLYIHIPFCKSKCSYCDFVSIPYREELAQPYLIALQREIISYAARLDMAAVRIRSLYIGGGTPTTLSDERLSELLDLCRQTFSFEAEAEITIEANPDTVTEENLYALKDTGFNRLSLGAQSFQERSLRELNRRHHPDQIRWAVAAAARAGFDNLSLDLMYALPGQMLKEWGEELREALSLEPQHISVYGLTLEEGTPLFYRVRRGELTLPDEEVQLAMYQLTRKMLAARGYQHYEISNFARPGKEARHNLIYWKNEEYLGLGAGAHSYLSGHRYFNEPHVIGYLRAMRQRGTALCGGEHPTPRQQMGETIMLGLRLIEGLDLPAFAHRFGRTLEEAYPETLPRLMDADLLCQEGNRLYLTHKGIFLSNEVFAEFL